MPRPISIGILSAVFAATTLTAGVAGQDLRLDTRRIAVPAVTGVEAAQLLLARGWPQRLRIYESRWGSPMRLRVGVANARQVEEVRALDKSSRPARGFQTSFTALPLPDCGAGSSACVEVAVRPAGAGPGTYRIGVVADGRLLMLDPPIEMVCNPFRAPISLSLGPSHGLGRQGAASGRVRLGCPALPTDALAEVVGYHGPTVGQSIGNTVVYLRRAVTPLTDAVLQVVFPDSVIVQPGHNYAEFEAWAPEHLAPVNGRVLHVNGIHLGIRAELRGVTGASAKALGGTSFEYPRLDRAAFSLPPTIVGSQSVTGSIALTQRSSMDERVCFSVYDNRGALAGSAGHRFTVTAAGAPGPGCLTIPSGQISASFGLDAQLATNLTQGGDFKLRATRSHLDTNGWNSLDTATVPFKAWLRPALQAVTIGAPPSQPSHINSVVNGAVSGQVTGYVALTSVAPPGGITVKLGCRGTDAIGKQLCEGHVSVPATLKIPEGAREMGFPIGITASRVEGRTGVQAMLDGRSVATALTVDLPPEAVLVDMNATGQANFRPLTVHVSEVVSAEPVRIALKISGDGARFFQIPQFVEVPVGAMMATVSVPVTPLPQPVQVTLAAARVGSKVVASRTVTIQP